METNKIEELFANFSNSNNKESIPAGIERIGKPS